MAWKHSDTDLVDQGFSDRFDKMGDMVIGFAATLGCPDDCLDLEKYCDDRQVELDEILKKVWGNRGRAFLTFADMKYGMVARLRFCLQMLGDNQTTTELAKMFGLPEDLIVDRALDLYKQLREAGHPIMVNGQEISII